MTAYEEHLINNGWSPEEAAVMYQRFSDPTFGRDPEMMREYQPGFLSIPHRAQIGEARPVTLAPAYTQRLMQTSPSPTRIIPATPSITPTSTPVVRSRNTQKNGRGVVKPVVPAFTPKVPVQPLPLEGTPESQATAVEAWRAKNADQLNAAKLYDESIRTTFQDPLALAAAMVAADESSAPLDIPSDNKFEAPVYRFDRNNPMGVGIHTASPLTNQTLTKNSESEVQPGISTETPPLIIEDENIAIPDYSLGSINPNQLGDNLLAQKRAKDYLAWSEHPALDYAYPPLELNQQALTDAAEDVKAITDYDAAQEWLALTAPSLIGMGVTTPILRGIAALPRARQALMAARIARQKARGEAAFEAARKASQLQADKLVKMGEEINNNHVLGSLKNLRRYIQNGDELAKVAVESNPNTPSGIVHLSKVAGKLNRVQQSAKSRYTSAKKSVQDAYKKAKAAPKNFLEQTKPTDIPVTETTLPPVNPPTATLAEKLNSYEQALADTFSNTAKSWWRGWR